MIAASRRRQTQGGDAFRLHEALAARASLSVRLRRGSVLALVASVVALFAGADVTTHLLAVAAGLTVGAAVPVRGAMQEALSFIRGRAGLSYETALGVMAEEGADEFGLRSAVVERARLAVRDVRPEPAPAWWLPALAVALGLVLFSLAGPFAGPRAGGGGSSPLPGGQAPASPEAAPADQREAEVPTPPEAAPGRADEAAAGDRRDEDQSAEGPGAAPPGAGDSAAAPLSRFLDSLRERPDDPTPQPEQPAAPGQPGQQPPRADGPASQGQQGQEQPERVQLERQRSSQAGEDPNDGGGDGESEGAQDGQGDDQGDGDGGQQPGPEQGERPQGGGEEDGQGEGGGDPSGSDQQDGQGGETPEAGGEQGDGRAGDTEVGLVPDDGSQPPDPDDPMGAGMGAGAETAAGVVEGDAGAVDVLPGVLQDGPENPAGTVRLPGDTDVFLPAGRAVTDYQSAAEEALSEGDLPLAYQEVIRRYFR